MTELDTLAPRLGDEAARAAADALVVERPNAEWLLLRAADAVALPGAVARMLEAARDTQAASVVVGTGIPIAVDGTADRERIRVHARRHHERVARFPDASYLAVYGHEDVAAVLLPRTRMKADEIEALSGSSMAAVLDCHASGGCIVLADPVCARRNDSMAQRKPTVLGAVDACRRLWRHVRERRVDLRALLSMAPTALAAAFGLEGAGARAREAFARTRRSLVWRVAVPLAERAYDFVLDHAREWPIGRAAPTFGKAAMPRRVVYYIWRYPVLSETFIRRELAALEAAGVDVTVIADAPGADVQADAELEPLTRSTHYVLPLTLATVARSLLASLMRRPLRTVNLFVYVVGRPYNVPKSFAQDVRVFLKAVHVGSILRAARATHLHAPWGDTNAFIGMIAARLAGADFSLQFRAQDLHRRTLAFLVDEKVRNARFAVTNTRFNVNHLRSLVRSDDASKIRQIYNGLDLDRLTPARPERERAGGPIRILSVARLIEPKGLPYLFEACRTLLDRGRDLRCCVVGGAELPLYVNDLIEIRRRRHALGVEQIVELAGAQPFARVLEAYRSADIFVLPCVVGADASNDIIPNVILEAMAMGVPVVATAITAIPELIDDGETGLLVPPNDAAALADAIDRLLLDPELRASVAKKARARVEERFDVAKNIGAYAELFGA